MKFIMAQLFRRHSKLFKHNLIWVMMLVTFILSVCTIKQAIREFNATKATNHMFAGDGENVYYPGLSLKIFQSHELQKYVEKLIETKLIWRDLFIHAHNQVYYSLFKKTFVLNNTLIIGKHNQLFQYSYIDAYCNMQEKMNNQQHLLLVDWVKKIKEISNFFEKKGITFVYLITPSKAEYMPRSIPNRFHCKDIGLSQRVIDIEKILQDNHVRYVNGATLMVDASKTYHTAMFPKGGTHWNDLGASIAANKIIEAINQDHHVFIHPIRFNYRFARVEERKALDADDDLLRLIGLIKPDLSYIVPKVSYVKDNTTNKPLKVTFIGGSFIENVANTFMLNHSFAKITHYFYYNLQKRVYQNGSPDFSFGVNVDPSTPNELKDIFSSDVFILEENSSLIMSGHANNMYMLVKRLESEQQSNA